MRHAEKYLQQLLIGNLLRIETDTHRFGMSGIALAHLFVMRGCRSAARIAGHHVRHALDVLEHRIHAPETTAGKYRCLLGRCCGGV